MTYIRAWRSSKFGQILSGTAELAALEHLKIDFAPFSRFTVVFIPGNSQVSIYRTIGPLVYLFHMSLNMRKPAFCICENKDAD